MNTSLLTDNGVRTAVSSNLAKILEDQGKSIYWLMKSMDVSSGTIYPIIRGVAVPSATVLANIATVLEVSTDDILEVPEERILRKSRKSKKIS